MCFLPKNSFWWNIPKCFLLLILPHVSLSPRQRAVSSEEGCGDVSHWWSRGGAWSWPQPPSPPAWSGWEEAEPASGLGWGCKGPAAKSVQGSKRRLCLEMNAKELPVPSPLLGSPSQPHLSAVAQPGLAGLHTHGPALLSYHCTHKLDVQSSIKCFLKNPLLNSIVSMGLSKKDFTSIHVADKQHKQGWAFVNLLHNIKWGTRLSKFNTLINSVVQGPSLYFRYMSNTTYYL